ncbi:MAG TPA: 8-amino-7-oxononanoate synthase [Tepidisphaeraceae bacterium]|jgi:glycine C-acetyltransferase/8-amino-7-oxononanoate synthase|nr:8-amino-7-oxononanoate synthase [Tepidisphaeraceae bacterium]
MSQTTPEQTAWSRHVAADLQRLAASHLYRRRRTFDPVDATHVRWNDRTLVNFASNNYLGLSHHPAVRAAVERAVSQSGFGSGAAPLISGYSVAHSSAEKAIAQWKRTEAAVLLPSGYQANVAAIQTCAAIGKLGGGVRFLVDKLAHASLIDAIRGTGQPFRVFPHQHLGKLKRLLEEADAGELQVVVTESIFSMDGDAVDLDGICQLRNRYGFLLVLDEAHATGVYGPNGSGLTNELGLREHVDVSTITLSKALGGIGGAVCGAALFCDALVNYGRAYLFSTAVPPAVAAAGEAAIDVLLSEPARQARLRKNALWVRQKLHEMSLNIPPGDSPIIPIILEEERKAIAASEKMMEAGFLVPPIRPPTVPRGSTRLRITLSSEHTMDEIESLVRALACLA